MDAKRDEGFWSFGSFSEMFESEFGNVKYKVIIAIDKRNEHNIYL